MGGSSSTETKFTKSDPWAPAQPSLIKSLDAANNAFDTTYNGSSVTPVNPLVTQAQNMLVNNANSGQLSGISNAGIQGVSDVVNNGGLTQQQSGAATGILGALNNFNAQGAQNMDALNPIANGSMVGANPYLDQTIQNAMNDAATTTNRQFAASGRYGSGAQTSTLADRLGNIATAARMQAYNDDSNRQLQALGLANSANNDNLSGNVSGQGAVAGLGQQGLANTTGILANMPAMAAAKNIDANQLGQVGATQMGYSQAVLDAANQDPWTKAQNLANIAQGIGGMGGTSWSVGTKSTDPGVGGAIGGIVGGAGALNNLFAAPAGGTSAIAGMASLFAASDERIKENIEPVGKLDNGQKIFAYNFKGDNKPQIGLLAQLVEKDMPEAVMTDPATGIKMVNYGLASRNDRNRKGARADVRQ